MRDKPVEECYGKRTIYMILVLYVDVILADRFFSAENCYKATVRVPASSVQPPYKTTQRTPNVSVRMC